MAVSTLAKIPHAARIEQSVANDFPNLEVLDLLGQRPLVGRDIDLFANTEAPRIGIWVRFKKGIKPYAFLIAILPKVSPDCIL